MLDNHQFTLLIVAVGLGALLVSFNTVYQKEIEVLTAELEALQGEPSGAAEEGNSEARETLTKQQGDLEQRLESLVICLRHSLISVLLLLFFLILLTLRIFLWSWQTPPVLQGRIPGGFLWFDRALMSVLAVFLLHFCVSHLVFGVPLFLRIN